MTDKKGIPKYVYLHIDIKTGETIYVGVGTGERAWEWRDNKRSLEHNSLLRGYLEEGYVPSDWVSIVESNLDSEKAQILETELIELHKPKFNKCKNSEYISPKWKFSEVHLFAKNLRKQGYSYPQIAYLLGGSITQSHTMSAWRMVNVY